MNTKPFNWSIYMVQTDDKSFYVGISTDPKRRAHEHLSSPKRAKYFRIKNPVCYVVIETNLTRSEASVIESRLKKLSKKDKEILFNKNERYEIVNR